MTTRVPTDWSKVPKGLADWRGVRVYDDFLPTPVAYRAAALAQEFRTYEFPEATFHGIAMPTPPDVPERLRAIYPAAEPTLSFFRKSPEGQPEPHFIHTDADMGDWTALLYLNPKPPADDGTKFWRHLATGAIESAIPHERSREGRTTEGWEERCLVPAKFNRLVLFPATFFHSRAIVGNWGTGRQARLTQVVFGKGQMGETI
jgi:hypothetical protein